LFAEANEIFMVRPVLLRLLPFWVRRNLQPAANSLQNTFSPGGRIQTLFGLLAFFRRY
jgi:hypothetical protein